jgi:hypothetical protein
VRYKKKEIQTAELPDTLPILRVTLKKAEPSVVLGDGVNTKVIDARLHQVTFVPAGGYVEVRPLPEKPQDWVRIIPMAKVDYISA